MALPFKKEEASVLVPDQVIRREPDGEQDYDAMLSAAHDLIHSLKANDAKGVAEAIRAAFQIADSEPHFEGEHPEE